MKPFNNTRISSATINGVTFQQNESGAFKVFTINGSEVEGPARMDIVREIARTKGFNMAQAGMVLVSRIIKAANA